MKKIYLVLFFIANFSFIVRIQAAPKNCQFTIYGGERSEIFADASRVDSKNLNQATIVRYNFSELEGVGEYSDSQFLGLKEEDLVTHKIQNPIVYIQGVNLSKKINLGPLKVTEKIENTPYDGSGGKKGNFKIIALPSGSLYDNFRKFAGHNAKLVIKVFSGKKPVCQSKINIQEPDLQH